MPETCRVNPPYDGVRRRDMKERDPRSLLCARREGLNFFPVRCSCPAVWFCSEFYSEFCPEFFVFRVYGHVDRQGASVSLPEGVPFGNWEFSRTHHRSFPPDPLASRLAEDGIPLFIFYDPTIVHHHEDRRGHTLQRKNNRPHMIRRPPIPDQSQSPGVQGHSSPGRG